MFYLQACYFYSLSQFIVKHKRFLFYFDVEVWFLCEPRDSVILKSLAGLEFSGVTQSVDTFAAAQICVLYATYVSICLNYLIAGADYVLMQTWSQGEISLLFVLLWRLPIFIESLFRFGHYHQRIFIDCSNSWRINHITELTFLYQLWSIYGFNYVLFVNLIDQLLNIQIVFNRIIRPIAT